MSNETPPSAADHEWREIFVHIYPDGPRATFILRIRKFRGSMVQWDRQLSRFTVETTDADTVATLAGILTLIGNVALGAAERAR